jgi:alpha-amylase
MPGLARLCVLLGAAVLIASCKDANAPAPNITVTPGSAELDVGESRQFTALGGGSSVVWSSSQPDVASVVPQTGFVQALKRGQSTITASAGGASASATVTVLAPAALALSAPTTDFAVLVGGGDPAPKTVSVTNSGDRALGAVTLGTIAYGQGQPNGWLTATASGTNAPLTVTLTPRVGALGRGTYTAIVPVQSTGIANSPQNIAVTFRIQVPPSIALSRTSVSIAAIPAETKTETVNITNGGDVALTGLSTAVTYNAGQPQNWLTATLSSTGAPATLTLVANSGTLATGTYNATVRVSSSLSGVAARDVTVQLVISPDPRSCSRRRR